MKINSLFVLLLIFISGCEEFQGQDQGAEGGVEVPVGAEEVLYPYSFEHKALYMRDVEVHSVSQDVYIIDGDQSTLFVQESNETELSIVSNHVRGAGPLFLEPSSIAIDEDNSKIYIGAKTDELSQKPAIFEVDMVTGDRRIVMVNSSIVSPEFLLGNLLGLEVDSVGGRVFAINGSSIKSIIAVDIETGGATLFSGSSRGSGDAFGSPTYFSIDQSGGVLYVSDTSSSVYTYFQVDLATGDRSVLSSNSVGSGIEISYTGDLHFDSFTGDLFVKTNVLLRVDTQDGFRSLVTGGGQGNEGGYLAGATRIFGDSTGKILILNPNKNTIAEVEQSSGDLTSFVSSQTGTGDFVLRGGYGIFDDSGEYIFTGDTWDISKIKVSDGSRVRVSAYSNILADQVGSGPNISVSYMDYDAPRGRFYAGGTRHLFSVDESTGDRTIISSDTIGTGDVFLDYIGLGYDSLNNRVLTFSENLEALYAIDLGTGNRTVVSGNTVGTGPSLDSVDDAVFDATRSTAYALLNEESKIITVDVSTGNRTELFDISTLIPANELNLTCLAMDFTNNLAYLCNSFYHLDNSILKLDLNLGSIEVVTSMTKGVGPGRDISHEARLIVDQSNGQLYISSWGLIGVEQATGDRYPVSN